MKRFIKFVSLLCGIGLSIFIISIISYNMAYNKLSIENNLNFQHLKPTNTATNNIVNAAIPENSEAFWHNDDENIDIEYYIVRLDGTKLCVYIYNENSEEFMYDIDLHEKNLSDEEKLMLSQGKILYSKGELTAFIENYTS